ncbi:hypothetical protein ACVBEQ_03045 [Nakamurella sp. GG22]
MAFAPRRNGRPVGGQALSSHGRTATTPAADVDAALRAMPSHGWRIGWTGRRDRALLVLSQMAGLTYQSIAELTVGDISIEHGVAIVRTPGGTTTLRRADDVVICGPCALARWIHALDLTALYPTGQVAAAIIARAAPLTSRSPHLCEGRLEVAGATRLMPVLPTTDAWGPHTVIAGPGTTPALEPATNPSGYIRATAASTTLPTQDPDRAPRLALRLSRYPADGAPAANCDPSHTLRERTLRLLGQSAEQTR